jgi:thiosulfate/3-mercaptopyruvate sulfurtransferase
MGPAKDDFDSGHIPGAIYVNWIDDITDPSKPERYNIINKRRMEALLSRLGVANNSCIVIYDDLASRLSSRMFWSLRYYGHEDVHILDGGKAAWASMNELTAKSTKVARTNYSIENVNDNYVSSMKFIADHLRSPAVKLVDGRPPAQFSGEDVGRVYHTGTAHKKRGHIPGAVNVFWKENFNSDGTFKSRQELAELYASVVDAKTVVTYCNEGLHATPPWFVLVELLGRSDVRVYDDSMSEWANSAERTETGSGE